MFSLIGLGNFPAKYAKTRHNIGFRVVERFVEESGGRWVKPAFRPFKRAKLRGAVFFLPLTYMNNAGKIVRFVKKSSKPEEVLVLVDDLDLPFGSLKLRLSGGSGGHNGLASILDAFGAKNIPRLRIGIDRPQRGNVIKYVLSDFTEAEEKELPVLFKSAFAAIELWLSNQPRGKVIGYVNSPDFMDKFGGENDKRL